MEKTVRPETMERITTKVLADAFIEEQIKEIRAQVGDKKVLLALSAALIRRSLPHFSSRQSGSNSPAFTSTTD